METKEFTIVHLKNLKIDDLFSLNKSTIDYADPVKDQIGEMPKVILVSLKTDNHAMEMQMNKALKNELTLILVEMNADREDRFAEIKRNVTTALKGRDTDKKSAANSLKIFLDPYWDIYKKALNTRTGIFFEMLGKFNENATLTAHAATIGISEMMVGLAGVNSDFNEGYLVRLTQEATLRGKTATGLRTAVTRSYEQFCIAVEQAVNYTPSETNTILFNQLDGLRKTYARLATTPEEEPEASTVQAQ